MSNTYITEAFKQFNLLEESEEFGMDNASLDEFNSFLDDAMQDEEEHVTDVIDLEAEAKEDLKQSYIGKVILDCNVCHSNIFFNKDEVIIDDDGLVNMSTECPYCMSNEGYTIVGEIKPYNSEDVEDTLEDTPIEDEFMDGEEELADEPIEIEDEKSIEEGLKLDGVKALNGKASLRRTSEHDGDKKIRGRNNTKLSGTEDLHESKLNSLHDENFERDELIEESGQNRSLDLTATPGQSIAKLIHANHEKLDNAGTVQNLVAELEKIFKDANYKTKATERLLANVKKQRNFSSALMAIYNSYLKGTGDGVIKLNSSLDESIQDVSITTDDETMTMTTNENGGISVETTPVVPDDEVFEMGTAEDIPSIDSSDEIIAPLDDETLVEIESNVPEDEQPTEEEPLMDELPEEGAGSEEDIDMENFDDESFDELGESYLKRCYENVKSFKTTNISASPSQLMVEGVITFNSGNKKTTQFIFESSTTNAKHTKLKFEGYNRQITGGKKSFKLGCALKDKTVIPESLNYNYKSKNELNESVRVYGTVKRGV